MRWMEAVKKLSSNLTEPEALGYVWRGLREMTTLEWLLLMSREIAADDMTALTAVAARLAADEPPQYIVGWTDFCGLRLGVDARALIPRPETAELVARILAENADGPLRVLDIGTGTGAIAISLAARRRRWAVTATDLSPDALALARDNATRQQVAVKFEQRDVLDGVTAHYDLIVANPPYISPDALDAVDASVKKYEPHQALFAADQGLAIYKKLARQAPSALTTTGQLYLEIGYDQGAALRQLFAAAFPEKTVSLHQDSFGKDRILRVR